MAKIHIKPDGSGVINDYVKMAINPFDEIAVEQALVLREQGQATQVTVLSIGPVGCVETLRHALALGADQAIHIQTDIPLLPLDIAKLITHIVQKDGFDLVIAGKQAIDNDCNQVGQMVAALLGWPQGTFISQVVVEGKTLLVKREVDHGIEQLRLVLPCVLTTDLRLNRPRYASLPNVMKAKNKPLETYTLEQLNFKPREGQKSLQIREPNSREGGITVASIQELIGHLKKEQVL